ncbi:MAG: hypothetical protein NT116_04330 [Candidatus Parcubacteria bacterium]|nr:hypothetical protein [Candidatus Parcubacteria bacterium]
MSEIEKIFLTSALTIFGGVLIFVIGQIISKFIIDPIHEQKRLIGKIADSLIFYANVYTNPGILPKETMDKASVKFRQQATFLQSKTHLIPLYGILSILGLIVSKNNINKASENLIRISNLTHVKPDSSTGNIAIKNAETADEIKKLLKLKINL